MTSFKLYKQRIHTMISIGKKIFDEVNVPTNSRIISDDEDKLIIKRESS